MMLKIKILLLLSLVFLMTGCKDNLPRDLADERSLERYESLPVDSDLLLCLQSDGVLGKLPDLGSDGREMGRFGPSTLVVVSRDRVPALSEIEGLTGFVLWGDETAVEKLDPMLKSALLSAMALPGWRETKHRIIGTFDPESMDIEGALTAAGANPRSATGGIVTFSATCEVIFDILAWDNLRQLKQPTLMRPTQSLK